MLTRVGSPPKRRLALCFFCGWHAVEVVQSQLPDTLSTPLPLPAVACVPTMTACPLCSLHLATGVCWCVLVVLGGADCVPAVRVPCILVDLWLVLLLLVVMVALSLAAHRPRCVLRVPVPDPEPRDAGGQCPHHHRAPLGHPVLGVGREQAGRPVLAGPLKGARACTPSVGCVWLAEEVPSLPLATPMCCEAAPAHVLAWAHTLCPQRARFWCVPCACHVGCADCVSFAHLTLLSVVYPCSPVCFFCLTDHVSFGDLAHVCFSRLWCWLAVCRCPLMCVACMCTPPLLCCLLAAGRQRPLHPRGVPDGQPYCGVACGRMRRVVLRAAGPAVRWCPPVPAQPRAPPHACHAGPQGSSRVHLLLSPHELHPQPTAGMVAPGCGLRAAM